MKEPAGRVIRALSRIFAMVTLSLCVGSASETEKLAKETQNPVANLISDPLSEQL